MRKILTLIITLTFLSVGIAAYADTDTASNATADDAATFSSMKILDNGQIISAGSTEVVTTTTLADHLTKTSLSTAKPQKSSNPADNRPRKKSRVYKVRSEKQQPRPLPTPAVVGIADNIAGKEASAAKVAVRGERVENPSLATNSKPAKSSMGLMIYIVLAVLLTAVSGVILKVKRTRNLLNSPRKDKS